MSVHIPQLDAQHRQIIELLNELRRCAHSGKSDKLVATVFERVKRYGHWHLKREELVLRVRGYPDYAAHQAEHDAYREKVAALQAQLERRDVAVRITNFLSEWWRHHILTSDQRYARFLRHQPSNH